ncbi:hypothetical protein [Aliikangiella maris]|uniref:Uncharacterized protein n=2 Tax=Aliikangiella maris TaxID=3162458 RepID=A0ABV2C0C9_9GAMM
MPGVGLHGSVRTNDLGYYRITLAEAHDAVDLTICGSSVLIDKSEWKNNVSIKKDVDDCDNNH